MEKKETQKVEQIEIDLPRLARVVLDKAWLIGIVAVVCALLTAAGTLFFVTPQYQATSKFYVNNSSISVGGASISMSSGDLTASRNLVDSYIVILETRETLNDVIDYVGANISYKDLHDMISAAAVDSTEIFQVTVTSPDPQQAEQLANAIGYILPKRITTIIEGTSAKVVEAAVVPTSPSSPSYAKNTVIGFIFGLLAIVAVIVIRQIMDTTIRTEEDVTQICSYPVLAAIPDLITSEKSGAYYGYGRDRMGDNAPLQSNSIIGSDISFAGAEAYKLLRTKLQFSFAGDEGSRVIGISSALSGEGKSLSSVNLAYSLSELGKRVILIDCDMRRPTLAEKLKIQKKPGISSYLTGQSELVSLVQPCGIEGDERAFHVITAGENPPNPNELLSSIRMHDALDALRQFYDYVILDLPPISEVSDAMTIANETDGTLLVVRENYCDRLMLAHAIRQLEYINAKILGVVINCTTEKTGKYGKKYYTKYYDGKRKSGETSSRKKGNK